MRHVLSVRPWSRQAEFLDAIAQHRRVAVRSGHKVGKSVGFAGAALWWVATRQRGRVIPWGGDGKASERIRDVLRLWPQ